jgi:hypothetical protein
MESGIPMWIVEVCGSHLNTSVIQELGRILPRIDCKEGHVEVIPIIEAALPKRR